MQKTSGWVNQPNGRGTIDILWNCVLTCCLCCWTILCLNVPAKGESRLRCFIRKSKWAFITILGPEILLMFAAGQWATADRFVQKFRLCGYTGWTMRHAFFAEMGGFIVETDGDSRFAVNNAHICYLVTHGHMDFPNVDEERIKDQNKADDFARAITIWQVLWFCLQCFSRLIQHLEMTTMELSTLAFVFCSMPTFWCWSKKPLDVQVPFVLQLNKSVEEISQIAGIDRESFNYRTHQRTPFDFMDPTFWTVSSHAFSVLGLRTGPSKYPHERIANDRLAYVGHFKIIGGLFFSMAYMAINFAAWNFSFPTSAEKIIWRICCVTMVFSMAIAAAAMELMPGRFRKVSHWTLSHNPPEESVVDESESCNFRGRRKGVLSSMVSEIAPEVPKIQQYSLPSFSMPLFYALTLVFSVYSIVRLYFVVEVFVGLRSLPVSAYESVTWTKFLPHF